MHTVAEHAAQKDYVYFGDLPREWLISSIGRTRDSGILAESNWEVATGRLESECGPECSEEFDDNGKCSCEPACSGWTVVRDNHWACGWVEHFAAAPGSPAAALLQEWEDDLQAYPVLDETHWSNAEYTATLANVREVMSGLCYTADDEQAAAVYEWLSDNRPESVECRDDSGGYPDDDDITAACTALEFKPEGETDD